MSEQDKKSGGTGTTPVVVEQTTNSRHKAPYRPNDIQDETDHHKHSRPPAVQSVAEDVKNKTAEDFESENEDHKDQKRVKSNEMNKQSAAKKLSTIPKKHVSPPDSVALAQVELDTKKGSLTPPSQPIPQDVEALSGANFAEKEKIHKGETDSITEEIPDGRTLEPSKKYSNWDTSTKGREITWEENQQEKGMLPEIDAKSQAWMLERRASVGPCFRPGMPFEGPTGIAINIPRKSMSTVRSSGININISGKSLNSRSKINIRREKLKDAEYEETSKVKLQKDGCESKFLSTLKEKISSVHSKIKNVFNC